MSPTSRNTLLVGGALIVVALLLTCGPMLGWFGGTQQSEESLPAVAAAPPADATDALDAATAGAAAGGQAGLLGASALGEGEGAGAGESAAVGAAADEGTDEVRAAGAPIAGAAAAAAAVGAGAAAAGGAAMAAGGSGAAPAAAPALPAVSAGVPDTPVAGAGPGEAAVSSFDDAFAAESELSAAGPVVDRFAPPVAAFGSSPLALAAASDRFSGDSSRVRRPCDAPGAGCLNVSGGLGVVRPIIPGVRPPRPGANQPIVPGNRPAL